MERSKYERHRTRAITTIRRFALIIFSMEPSALLKRYDDLKTRLREDLKEELAAISGAVDTGAAAAAGEKTLRKSGAHAKADHKVRDVDTTDYFALVYECIDTRTNFLNVISLNSRSPVEPDIDLVILQALLNGKKENN